MPRFTPRKLIAQAWKFEGTEASFKRIQSLTHAPKGMLWYSGGCLMLNASRGLQRVLKGGWVMHYDDEWFLVTQPELDRRWTLTEE